MGTMFSLATALFGKEQFPYDFPDGNKYIHGSFFCLHAEASCKVAESLLVSRGFTVLLTKIYPCWQRPDMDYGAGIKQPDE